MVRIILLLLSLFLSLFFFNSFVSCKRIIFMKWYRIMVDSKTNYRCPYTRRYTVGRRLYEDWGRNWSDVATRQTPSIETRGRKDPALTCSLQNHGRIHFCCLKIMIFTKQFWWGLTCHLYLEVDKTSFLWQYVLVVALIYLKPLLFSISQLYFHIFTTE